MPVDESSPPIPSPADAGYLLFPLLALAGMIASCVPRPRRASSTLLVDGIAAALAVAALSAAIVFQTVLAHASGDSARRRHRRSPTRSPTSCCWPSASARWPARAGAWTARGRCWPRGILAFWFADSMYLVRTAAGTYEAGGWFDAGWWGGAAWRSPSPPGSAPPRAPASLRRRHACALIAAPLARRRGRARAARLRLARARSTRSPSALAAARAGLRDDPADADVPPERRDAARLARRGADRRADRPRQPARADARARRGVAEPTDDRRSCSRSSTSTASSTTTTPSATRPATSCSTRLGANLRTYLGARGHVFRMGGDEFCALLRRPRGQDLRDAARRRRARAVRARRRLLDRLLVRLDHAARRGERRRRGAAHRRPAHVRPEARRPHLGRPARPSDVLLSGLSERDPELGGHASAVAALAERHRPPPRARSRRAARSSATPPSCTTSARSRSPTRSFEARAADRRGVAFIRRHPVAGERIIAAAPALGAVAQLVRSSPRALGRHAATPTGSAETTSRSARGSSRSPTRSTR